MPLSLRREEKLITNINLSGLHPIDAFMRYMSYMRFMKSGKSLARNLPHALMSRKLPHNPGPKKCHKQVSKGVGQYWSDSPLSARI